jgi:hypothetical protein
VNSRQRRLRARTEQRQGKFAPDVANNISGLTLLATLGRPVTLQAIADDTETNGPVWVECCLSGTYLGHPNAEKLEWGPQLFDLLIANLRSNPSYRKGADGFGCVRVIPWDYEHESEIAKSKLMKFGTPLPKEGLPARSWTNDFDIRPGSDGQPSFWALTEFLPLQKQQVRNGEYRWCSIAVAQHFDNPITGVDQGPTVTSIAFTNDPFIQGMVPLAAARKGLPITQTLDQWGPAESPEEALVGLRKIFKLADDAAPQVVLGQLTTLRGLIESRSVPEYLGVDYVLERIRDLLELPLLSLPVDVLGGAEAAVNRLLTGGRTADSSASSTSNGDPNTMGATVNSTALALAAILRCKEDESVILQATQKAVAAADKSTQAEDAFTKLRGLIGGDDWASTIANATKLLADARQLGPALEALQAAQTALKGGAETDAKNETDLVAASIARGDPDLAMKIKPVILAARMGCFDPASGIVDPVKLEAFRKDYPLAEEQKALLSRRIVAGTGGVQLGGAATGYQTQPIMQSAGIGAPSAEFKKVSEAFNASPGRNPVEKAHALLCSRSAIHKALDWGTQCRVAGEFARTLQEGKIPAGFTL